MRYGYGSRKILNLVEFRPRGVSRGVAGVPDYTPGSDLRGLVIPTVEHGTLDRYGLTIDERILAAGVYFHTVRDILELLYHTGHIDIVQISRVTGHVQAEHAQVRQITELRTDVVLGELPAVDAFQIPLVGPG